MKHAVLMYHAIGAPELVDGADPHYSITVDAFGEHLKRLKKRGLQVCSVRDAVAGDAMGKHIVACTFDDGHISNYEYAFPALLANGMAADFFINPTTVGKKNYVTWSALREMDKAGMSIQSHSYTHRYLEELNQEEIHNELAKSKAVIEDKIGSPVTVFAPPGGRINSTVHRLARAVGYKTVCVSRPGRWQVGRVTVPRFAVLESTTPETVESWAEGSTFATGRQVTGYWVRYVAKKVLGNELYDRVRERILKSQERGI